MIHTEIYPLFMELLKRNKQEFNKHSDTKKNQQKDKPVSSARYLQLFYKIKNIWLIKNIALVQKKEYTHRSSTIQKC